MNAAGLGRFAGVLLCLPLSAAAAMLFVDAGNPEPVSPYTNWVSAATNIQDAIDAAEAGDVVWVSNGVYAAGGRAIYGLSNRVALTKALTVQSVGGPAVTVIRGAGPSGPDAVRCAYLTNGARLAGFTLTLGAPDTDGDIYQQGSCGGAWCESASAVVSNCVLAGNDGGFAGGGAFQGTFTRCTLSGNSAFLGGAAYAAALEFCTLSNNTASYGGAAYSATADNCEVIANLAETAGGGACGGTLNSCVLRENTSAEGGAAFQSTLNNCTVSGNSANYAGGASGSVLNNCIVYDNQASEAGNTDADRPYGSRLNACCTTPMPRCGADNFTNAPLFLNGAVGDLRLQTNSPCINAGRNACAWVTNDLDGNPRIRGRTVDLGAYEVQAPASITSYEWLQVYGMPVDGSADSLDPDLDGQNNWQEWVAGTDPTNAASALRVTTLVNNRPGVLLRWSSDTNHSYFLQRAERLRPRTPFRPLVENVPGLAGWTTYTDRTVAAAFGYYRVGTGSTNGAVAPVLQPPVAVPADATLTWLSVTNRTYFVERATNRVGLPAFSVLKSNLPGLAGTTSFADTRRPAAGPVFYRVGVIR